MQGKITWFELHENRDSSFFLGAAVLACHLCFERKLIFDKHWCSGCTDIYQVFSSHTLS